MNDTVESPKAKPVSASSESIQMHPFAADASPQFIQTLTLFDEIDFFKTGQIIFHEGGYAERFYLIETGTVALETGELGEEPFVIQHLGPGDVLGWSWLYPPFLWHFTARALTDCRAIAFDAPALMIYAQEHPEFGFELMKRLSQHVIQRLQHTRQRLLEERRRSRADQEEREPSSWEMEECRLAGSGAGNKE